MQRSLRAESAGMQVLDKGKGLGYNTWNAMSGRFMGNMIQKRSNGR